MRQPRDRTHRLRPFTSGPASTPSRCLLEARCGIAKDMDSRRAATAATRGSRAHRRSQIPMRSCRWLTPSSASADAGATRPWPPKAASSVRKSPPRSSGTSSACFDGGPGLLLIEDLQWLDESTITLLTPDAGRRTGHGPHGPHVACTGTIHDRHGARTAAALLREDCLRIIDALDPVGFDPPGAASVARRPERRNSPLPRGARTRFGIRRRTGTDARAGGRRLRRVVRTTRRSPPLDRGRGSRSPAQSPPSVTRADQSSSRNCFDSR